MLPKKAGDTFLDGKLEIIRVLGAGGMGVVYEVRHTLTKHRRALKVMTPREANATIIKRFLQEASVAGTLDTDYITQIFDAGQLEDGSFYVLMEMLEGDSLREVLDARGKLPAGLACAVVREACRGLRIAHEAGVIHRDLKPENIFLVNTGGDLKVKLIDFGISKFENAEELTGATETGAILGTPLYMSPEQLRNSKNVDLRTDIYALGVVLYEMVTGRRPFEAESLPELLVKIFTGECVAAGEYPELDTQLASVIERAMQLDRGARFQTTEELEAAMDEFATELVLTPVGARTDPMAFMATMASEASIPKTMESRHAPPPRRVWWPALLLALALGAGLTWVLTRTEAPAPTTPEQPQEPDIPNGAATPERTEMTSITEMTSSAEMTVTEMRVAPTTEMTTQMTKLRPSERDGLMRPGYSQ